MESQIARIEPGGPNCRLEDPVIEVVLFPALPGGRREEKVAASRTRGTLLDEDLSSLLDERCCSSTCVGLAVTNDDCSITKAHVSIRVPCHS
jgi:hypothetical protein